MKKLLIFVLLIMMLPGISAQHMPPGINYQAVARDNAGNELKSKNLNIRISIVRDDPTGVVEYSETHSVTTDKFGLFNLVIGQGSYYTGEKDEFMNINWGAGSHFLRVEVDFGQGFIAMGTMQFLAVPYALYAANAGSTSGEEDMDKDPENELQILSLEGQVLQIKQGNTVTNSVTLSDVVNDADADPENERQDLNIDQDHKLKITNNPNASVINLSPYLDNTDNQELTKTHNTIGISGGNSIVVDVDSTNELQTLSSATGRLSISKGNGEGVFSEVEIFDADADSTNELQTLSSREGKISISNAKGEGTLMEVDVYDADADPQNEIQSLSINGYELSLSKSGVVNIRPEIMAFRAFKNFGESFIAPGDSAILIFDEAKLDLPSGIFNPLNGTFTVPPGGAGLYSFCIIYDYNNTNQELIILRNGIREEEVFQNFSSGVTGAKSYEFMYDLAEGETIKIRMKVTANPSIQTAPAVFSGYRIH